jgi:hypothetical protein
MHRHFTCLRTRIFWDKAKVVIPGVRRPFGGRAGGPVHYALYEPGGVL